MTRILTTIALGVALTIPSCAMAQDQYQHHRYYDRRHRDYHEFDEHENRAWRIYAEQQRHANWNWELANERRRQQYWDWRHNHSDALLRIDIR